ncbi:hypothetical protein CTAYLR_001450, partial [Chrysophaeum taylorii]
PNGFFSSKNSVFEKTVMIRRRLSGALVLAGAWAEDFSCCFYPAVNNRCAVCETFATSDDFCAQSQSNCDQSINQSQGPMSTQVVPAANSLPDNPRAVAAPLDRTDNPQAHDLKGANDGRALDYGPDDGRTLDSGPDDGRTLDTSANDLETDDVDADHLGTDDLRAHHVAADLEDAHDLGAHESCAVAVRGLPDLGFAASTDANPFCALSASNCESCEGTFCPGENAGTAAYTYQPTRAPTPKPLPTPKPTIAPSSSGYSICCLFSSTGAPCTACGGFIASTDTNPFCASSEANCDSCGGEFCKGENAGTAAYTFPPTPESAAVSSCSNDPTWYKRGDPDKDCAWVEKFVPTRCAVKGATTFAYQGCPLACGTCANSECGAESTSWYLGSNPSKNCGWVADAAGNRCHKQADGTYAFEACPFACSACSISGCEDSDDWAKPGEPSKDCSWVAEAKSNRCIVLGADGTYAYESCSAACHSCYEALVGSDCANDESWHKRADPSKTCDWVASFTPARCLVKGEDDEWGFEMCPEACDAC